MLNNYTIILNQTRTPIRDLLRKPFETVSMYGRALTRQGIEYTTDVGVVATLVEKYGLLRTEFYGKRSDQMATIFFFGR